MVGHPIPVARACYDRIEGRVRERERSGIADESCRMRCGPLCLDLYANCVVVQLMDATDSGERIEHL